MSDARIVKKRPLRLTKVRPPTTTTMRKPLAAKTTARRSGSADPRLRQARSFLHQLVSGMAGWLTYEQMQQALDNLREAELAKPLQNIARGRGYEVRGEFPLLREEGKRGAPPRLDFLLVNHARHVAIAIETKYKKKNSRMAGSIGGDARRLSQLTIDAIDAQIQSGAAAPFAKPISGYALLRAVVVVWHQSDIMEQMRLEPVAINRQYLELVSALLPEGVEATSRNFAEAMLGRLPILPVAKLAGALRPGSTYTYKRFWVACLVERSYWATLPARPRRPIARTEHARRLGTAPA